MSGDEAKQDQDPTSKTQEVDAALMKFRADAPMKAPDEIKHAVRVFKRSDIRKMVMDLLERYKGMTEAKLIEKIEELERLVAAEREKVELEYRDRLHELEKRLAVEQGKVGDLEARLAAAQAEIDRLNQELEALRKALSSEDLRSRAELERLVAELQAKIFELEMGLDYFDLEEAPDPERARPALEEAGKRLESMPSVGTAAAVRDRLAKLTAELKTAQEKFDLLKEKMDEGKGTIGVVVDLVKAVKDGESAGEQARQVAESLQAGRS
jgi:uncharacterized coiled-coil protein SlyX